MISGPSGKIIKDFKRPSKEIIEAFKHIPSTIAADCYRRYSILDPRMRPLNPNCTRFCGPALTVEDIEGGNFMGIFAIEYMKPGDVLIIDAKSILTRASLGGINAEVFKRRGGAAIVVNGSVRDAEELANIGYPVFSMGVTPSGPHKGVRGNVNSRIAIGSASINPGDLIIGDSDGIICIAQEDIEEMLKLCNQRLEDEKEWLKIVDKGGSMVDVLDLTKKLTELNVEMVDYHESIEREVKTA